MLFWAALINFPRNFTATNEVLNAGLCGPRQVTTTILFVIFFVVVLFRRNGSELARNQLHCCLKCTAVNYCLLYLSAGRLLPTEGIISFSSLKRR